MSTPYMGLTLPTVSVTLGPTWATEINDAFDLIDAHDHTSGKGVPIRTAAIDIDDDLDFNSFSAVGLAGVEVENQSSLTTANTYGAISGNPIYANGSIANTRLVNVSFPMVVGDLIYASSTTAFGKLGIGSTGQVLKVAAGLPTWSSAGNTFVVSTQTGASFTASVSVDLYLCNPSNAQAITLPVSTGSGHSFLFKKLSSSFATSDAITISRSSSDNIVDASGNVTSTTLNTVGEELEMVDVSAGTWQVVNRRVPSICTAYTPTGSWVANTTYTGFWKRIGDSMALTIHLAITGTPTTAALTINLPSGITIDTAKLASGTAAYRMLGTASGVCNGSSIMFTASYETTTAVSMYVVNTGGTFANITNAVTQAVPDTWVNTDKLSISVTVPITGWNG